MGNPIVNLRGKRFGRLRILYDTGLRSSGGNVMWRCLCVCGKRPLVSSNNLRNRNVSSCGCLRRDECGKRFVTHNMTASRTWNSWQSMMNRCYADWDKDHISYKRYGITVCSRWHNFENFYIDMGPRPEGMTLDRIDPQGDYEPENCRWANKQTQARNTTVSWYKRYRKLVTSLVEQLEIGV